MSKRLLAYSLIHLLLISACSNIRPPQALWLTPQQQVANADISHWQIAGKIGLRGMDSANTGYLNWQQCDQQYEIRLSGPLGQGAALLSGNQYQVQLQTNDSIQSAANPEQLLAQQGWQLPVSQLLYWVRGLPDPTHAVSKQSASGFSQMGWRIEYSKWLNLKEHSLPRKAVATHPDMKVTLLLNNWAIAQACSLEPLPINPTQP